MLFYICTLLAISFVIILIIRSIYKIKSARLSGRKIADKNVFYKAIRFLFIQDLPK